MRYYNIVLLLVCVPLWAQTTLHLRSDLHSMGELSTGAGSCGYSPYNEVFRTLSTTSSSSQVSTTVTPATGSTPPCRAPASSTHFAIFVSDPLSSAVTITSVTGVGACNESAGLMNAGIRYVVYRWSRAVGGMASIIVTLSSGECSTSTPPTNQNLTGTTTSTDMSVGDRIVVVADFIAAGGSWGANSSRTVTFHYNGTSNYAASITVTPSLSFQSPSNTRRPVVW